MKLSERLKELRKEKGLSIREASELIGLSSVSLCHYETGACQPTAISLAKIAKAYGADYEELYRLGKE